MPGVLLGSSGAATAQEGAGNAPLRYRWATIGALFSRARKAHTERAIPLSEYGAAVNLLREEKLVVFADATAHSFVDKIESNFRRRGMLKFPSRLETGSRLLREGKDPAAQSP
jgi:hypothetical protein